MKLGTLSVLALGSVLVGCVDYSHYTDEDDTGLSSPTTAVTVEPVTEEAVEDQASASAEAERAVVTGEAGAGFSAKDFVKAMPANPFAGPDGLERHRDWAPLSWDNRCTGSVWKRSESADDVVLVVALEGGTSDKAGVSRSVNLAIKEGGTLRMDVYNGTTRAIPVTFAVFSSVDRVYSEAKVQNAASGWTHLEFDLDAPDYKTASSEWKYTAKLWGPEDVREIVLLFYDGGVGQLAVDRLEVDAQGPADQPAEPPVEEPAPPVDQPQ